MHKEIRAEAQERGVSRSCHFTSSNNFIHILKAGGIKDRNALNREADVVVNPTDEHRLDGRLDRICCSVEYPNTYYLDKVKRDNVVFRDWLVVFLTADLLWRNEALFSKRNAAAEGGAHIRAGAKAFRRMFADYIDGARGHRFVRSDKYLPPCPTDAQAEVLVVGPIALSDIIGVAVASEEQGRTELARWRTLRIAPESCPIFVAPTLFDKIALYPCIRRGERPVETLLG